MRAKIAKEKLEEIQKYIATKDKEGLAKFRSELFGDWELEEVKTEPASAKYEPHPTITTDESSATTTATAKHTRTIKISPATLMVDSSISTTEDVLSEFQSIYDSWGLPSTEATPFLTTRVFEQIPSLIIKDVLETLIATDIKDKIKYYVNETPVLDVNSIYPYHHLFKVAIEGYREKVNKFHLSTDRIQELYQQTTLAPKKDVEKMFKYIFKDSTYFQFKSDQFYFAIFSQIPYFISEYKKPRVLKSETWEGIREDTRRYIIKDEDEDADWRRVRDSDLEI